MEGNGRDDVGDGEARGRLLCNSHGALDLSWIWKGALGERQENGFPEEAAAPGPGSGKG